MFVSSFTHEGKTFVSCNIAATLAQQGLRTIVLDLDMRRPRLEEFFTGTADKLSGLTDVLQQKVKLADVVQKDKELSKLAWLPSGTYVSDPSELLVHGLLRSVLDNLLKEYDRVIIDSPPLHPVKDALLVCGEVDGVILIVNARKTPRHAAGKTVQWLDAIKAPLLGIVLNLQPRRHGGYGYYYHYYYGHDGYGKSSLDARRTEG
jgi:capsular exopolysaccharide synthesis family protein